MYVIEYKDQNDFSFYHKSLEFEEKMLEAKREALAMLPSHVEELQETIPDLADVVFSGNDRKAIGVSLREDHTITFHMEGAGEDCRYSLQFDIPYNICVEEGKGDTKYPVPDLQVNREEWFFTLTKEAGGRRWAFCEGGWEEEEPDGPPPILATMLSKDGQVKEVATLLSMHGKGLEQDDDIIRCLLNNRDILAYYEALKEKGIFNVRLELIQTPVYGTEFMIVPRDASCGTLIAHTPEGFELGCYFGSREEVAIVRGMPVGDGLDSYAECAYAACPTLLEGYYVFPLSEELFLCVQGEEAEDAMEKEDGYELKLSFVREDKGRWKIDETMSPDSINKEEKVAMANIFQRMTEYLSEKTRD